MTRQPLWLESIGTLCCSRLWEEKQALGTLHPPSVSLLECIIQAFIHSLSTEFVERFPRARRWEHESEQSGRQPVLLELTSSGETDNGGRSRPMPEIGLGRDMSV